MADHSTVWVERGLYERPAPTPCCRQGQPPPQQAARSPIQPERLHGEGIHDLCLHLTVKPFLPISGLKRPSFRLKPFPLMLPLSALMRSPSPAVLREPRASNGAANQTKSSASRRYPRLTAPGRGTPPRAPQNGPPSARPGCPSPPGGSSGSSSSTRSPTAMAAGRGGAARCATRRARRMSTAAAGHGVGRLRLRAAPRASGLRVVTNTARIASGFFAPGRTEPGRSAFPRREMFCVSLRPSAGLLPGCRGAFCTGEAPRRAQGGKRGLTRGASPPHSDTAHPLLSQQAFSLTAPWGNRGWLQPLSNQAWGPRSPIPAPAPWLGDKAENKGIWSREGEVQRAGRAPPMSSDIHVMGLNG